MNGDSSFFGIFSEVQGLFHWAGLLFVLFGTVSFLYGAIFAKKIVIIFSIVFAVLAAGRLFGPSIITVPLNILSALTPIIAIIIGACFVIKRGGKRK